MAQDEKMLASVPDRAAALALGGQQGAGEGEA